MLPSLIVSHDRWSWVFMDVTKQNRFFKSRNEKKNKGKIVIDAQADNSNNITGKSGKSYFEAV